MPWKTVSLSLSLASSLLFCFALFLFILVRLAQNGYYKWYGYEYPNTYIKSTASRSGGWRMPNVYEMVRSSERRNPTTRIARRIGELRNGEGAWGREGILYALLEYALAPSRGGCSSLEGTHYLVLYCMYVYYLVYLLHFFVTQNLGNDSAM